MVERRHGARIVFAAGASAHLGAELERAGVERALLVCTPRARAEVDALAATLGRRAAGVFDGARQHVPVDVARAGVDAADAAGADAIACYGGGSPIGLGKAIALERDVVVVAIPTTYAGSEMTPIWGLTGPDGKRTGRDERVRPRVVLYDPPLTHSLPVAVSMTSGFNAMAHAAEALYAEAVAADVADRAEASLRELAEALPAIAEDPTDEAARSGALHGAYLAADALGTVGMAVHHKLCHVLGGAFGLPHAETHTAVLPHAIHFNREAAPDAMARIAGALGAAGGDAAGAIYDLAARVGAPTSLRELGLDEADLPRAAELAVERRYYNPRPIDRDSILALLRRAHAGARPQT